MKFKHDIEMWHKIREFSKELENISGIYERASINRCAFFSYDDEAFEEDCCCPEKEKSDFNSEKECWKCSHYLDEVKK